MTPFLIDFLYILIDSMIEEESSKKVWKNLV